MQNFIYIQTLIQNINFFYTTIQQRLKVYKQKYLFYLFILIQKALVFLTQQFNRYTAFKSI